MKKISEFFHLHNVTAGIETGPEAQVPTKYAHGQRVDARVAETRERTREAANRSTKDGAQKCQNAA